MLLITSHESEEDYQKSIAYLRRLIALHEEYGRIIHFPSFLAGNAIVMRKGDSMTGEGFEMLLERLKSLKEDTINRK